MTAQTVSPSGVSAACWKQTGVWGDHSCAMLSQHTHCRHCPIYSAAGRRLLDREVSENYLAEATVQVAKPVPPRTTATESVALFRIGGEWLALPARVCVEISPRQAVHGIPHAPARTVKGLVNIHGELLVCVTLREVLGLPERTQAEKTRHHATERMVVLAREGQHLVFPVSEVFGLHRFHPSELRDVPVTLVHNSSRYIRAILPWHYHWSDAGETSREEVSVGLLDDELLFHTLNRSLA